MAKTNYSWDNALKRAEELCDDILAPANEPILDSAHRIKNAVTIYAGLLDDLEKRRSQSDVSKYKPITEQMLARLKHILDGGIAPAWQQEIAAGRQSA
jgi:hypothetical protein